MGIQLKHITVQGWIAKLLALLSYRITVVPAATKGHTHRFFSFYRTKELNLRTDRGEIIRANNPKKWTIWVVPPKMFHEWITDSHEPGMVVDMTPLHHPHVLAT